MPDSGKYRSEILFAFAVAVLLILAYVARQPLILIYVSALFAAMVSPIVDRIHRISIGGRHLSRGLALLLIVTAGLTLAVVLGVVFLPRVAKDLQQLSADLPHRVSTLMDDLKSYPLLRQLDVPTLQQHIANLAGRTLQFFPAIATGVLGVFTFLILTMYFILEGKAAFRWGISLFPTDTQPRLEATLRRAQDRMWKWLAGQALLMLILGTCSAIVYGFLGIPYALVLGLFTGLANIVPIVGPVASVILTAGVAATESWTKALGVIVFYTVYQQVENAFLTPRIMKELVGLPGLAVIIALSVGGALAGFLGALVAVPSAALVAVIVREYLQHPRATKTEPTT
jgi:predicted PurR-regulated permease PerM